MKPLHQRIALLSLILLLFYQNVWAGQARLYVKTHPHSVITIWNIKTKFQQGMHLPAGHYDLQVHKAGYEAYRKTIYMGKKDRYLSVRLQPKNVAVKTEPVYRGTYPLYVQVNNVPMSQVKISVLNIKPNYSQGMLLKAGDYKLQIKAVGYQPDVQWVAIKNQPVHLDLNLIPQQTTYSDNFVGNTDEDLNQSGQYPLYVSTVPDDAEIKLLNIKQRFYQGIQLPAGRYLLEVSKQGFSRQQQWVTVANSYVYLHVDLANLANNSDKKAYALQPATPMNPNPLQLNIKTQPVGAQVFILNIQQMYRSGMRLPAGRYLLQVSYPGYQTYEQWIELSSSDVNLEIRL